MDSQQEPPAMPSPTAYRVIRAKYTPTTITVYQAYKAEIATAAVTAQKFVPPFRRTRMTWIKPSFLWMAYRCGYATKPQQEHVLAIEITREGFEWALRNSCLSHASRAADETQRQEWKERLERSPVRIQWDPERDLSLAPLSYRSIQIGVCGEAVDKYVDEWIVGIRDVTEDMKRVKALYDEGKVEEAKALLPEEKPYPLSAELREVLQAS